MLRGRLRNMALGEWSFATRQVCYITAYTLSLGHTLSLRVRWLVRLSHHNAMAVGWLSSLPSTAYVIHTTCHHGEEERGDIRIAYHDTSRRHYQCIELAKTSATHHCQHIGIGGDAPWSGEGLAGYVVSNAGDVVECLNEERSE